MLRVLSGRWMYVYGWSTLHTSEEREEMVRDCSSIVTHSSLFVDLWTSWQGKLRTEFWLLSESPPPTLFPHFLPLSDHSSGGSTSFHKLPLIDTVEPWEPSARFQCSAKCVQSTTACRMPPSGTPQVIYNPTTSLARVLVYFHLSKFRKKNMPTALGRDPCQAFHQIATVREGKSWIQSRAVISALGGFSLNACVGYEGTKPDIYSM